MKTYMRLCIMTPNISLDTINRLFEMLDIYMIGTREIMSDGITRAYSQSHLTWNK